jgi:hypothetical protein
VGKSVILALVALLAPGMAFSLDIGVGVADITPDVKAFKVPMAGYGARMGKPSAGVHDPLHAKILFMRDGDTRMALITCDLRSSTPEFKQRIVRKCSAQGLTMDNTFIAAAHTHDGPSMYPEKFWQLQFGAYDPKIVDIMAASVAKAVAEAEANAAPAKIGFAQGMADGFTRNRRSGYDEEARKAAGEQPPIDPRVSVMRVDGMDGGCRAIIVNFASHPTILPASNLLISAEWPGVLQRELEKSHPGAVAFFVNGAEGDQSPAGAKGDDDFAKIEDYGTRLAQVVSSIAAGAQPQPNLSIGISRITPELPPLTFSEESAKKFAKYMEAAQRDLPRKAEIQVLRVGPVALVGLPGEPLMAVGHAVRDAVLSLGFEEVVVAGLANDYIGYLVNESEYAHGGYEVESRSYYGPGLGRFLAEHSRQCAEKLQAKEKN